MSQFTFVVDFDERRWRKIKKKNYADVDSELSSKAFPIERTGRARVVAEVVRYPSGISIDKYLLECESSGSPKPDRAIGETFLDTFPIEARNDPIIIPCGKIGMHCSTPHIASVDAYFHGRELSLHRIYGEWHSTYRFLRIKEITPIENESE